MTSPTRHAVSHVEALARLRKGNQRFAQNVRSIESLSSQDRRGELVDRQAPFAIVLSCSDSRVPSELVFDAGLGDLFVVRVAGNIVAPSLVGSIEFAAATFGSELVVVMGHSRCGAVSATIEALKNDAQPFSENIKEIVNRIAPGISELVEAEPHHPELMHKATRLNVRHSVSHLRHASGVIERRIAEGRLSVVGAEYSLETGVVDFFDLP